MRNARLQPLLASIAILSLAACTTSTASSSTSSPDSLTSTTSTPAATADVVTTTVPAATTSTTAITTTTSRAQVEEPPVDDTVQDPPSDEAVLVQNRAHALVAPDGAYGSGCSPGSGPLPDGLWFGFVADRSSDSFEFDLACIYPDPLIDQPPVNTSLTLRSVAVTPDVQVREMRAPVPTFVRTTYEDWRPEACQFDEGCAAWIEILDGKAIYISEEFFS